jgi:uncharacterized membrane protein (UPF0127 family)
MDLRVDIHRADSWLARLRGLIGTASWPRNRALHIRPCNAVHTCFMRYAIDVVFVDRRGRIVKVVAALKPWRAAAAWRAAGVLELAAGEAERVGWRVGVTLPRKAWH